MPKLQPAALKGPWGPFTYSKKSVFLYIVKETLSLLLKVYL